MRARIVRIGNSRGVRLPHVMLETAQLTDEVELHSEPGRIVIRSAHVPRQGWAVEAHAMHAAQEDKLIASPASRFDAEEWGWG